MSGSGDGFQIGGVTTLAVVLDHAGSVAGGVGDLRAGVPIVAERVGVVIHIALTAAGAGVGGEALVVAGRSSDHSPVVMAQRVNIVALEALAAISTGEDGVAHLLTGGFRRGLLEAVAVGVLQNRAADGAKLRLGAGGSSAVLMLGSGQRLAVLIAAVEAGVFLQTFTGAGGLDLHSTGVEAMALGIGIAAHIGLTAAVADIDGLAAGDAGGRSDIRLVVVAQNGSEVRDLALAALGALLHGVAGHRAGSGHVVGGPAMLALGGDGLLDGTAVPADVQDLTAVGAVSLTDEDGLPGMADVVHVVALLDHAADGADIPVIAQGIAGGAHGLDEDIVVIALGAILVLAVGAGALFAIAILLAAAALAASAVIQIRSRLIAQPDVGDAILGHAHALVGVGDLVVDGVLALLGIAGRRGHGAGLRSVAVADHGIHASLGEIRDGERMGFAIHNAVVIGNDGLSRYEIIAGVLAVMAVLDDGKTLVVDLRQDVHMQVMGLQRLGMRAAGSVTELAVAAAVHDLLVVGRVSILIGHDIIQILGKGRGTVIQPVDVLAEAIIADTHVGVHSAAGLAAGFRPVVTRIGGVDTRRAVQDRAGAGAADERTVRVADIPGHGRLAVLGVLGSTPDLEAGGLLTGITMESLMCHGGVDVELVGAVGSVQPTFCRIMVAILLTGEGRNSEQGHDGDNDQQHCEHATTAVLGFGVHADTSEIIVFGHEKTPCSTARRKRRPGFFQLSFTLGTPPSRTERCILSFQPVQQVSGGECERGKANDSLRHEWA